MAAAADQTVRHAASIRQRNLTEFVQEAAINEAERVLADRTTFTLESAQWEKLTALLDRPPRDNPDLARLFSKPNVFA